MTIVIKTSNGSGVTYDYPNDKYFSSDINITEETDGIGGDIKSYSADFTIDDDKDLLFTDTIFNQLTVVGGFVTVKILINGSIRFYGSIISDTIQSSNYYATNDAIDNKKVSIKFRCNWILDVLRNINSDDVYDYIIANPFSYSQLSVDGFSCKFSPIPSIIGAIFSLLDSNYGIKVLNLTGFSTNDYIFYSQDNSSTPYYYISEFNPHYSRVSDGSINGTNKIGILIDTIYGKSGLFDVTNDNYVGTAYDLFVGYLKSFALYPKIQYDDSEFFDLFISIGKRNSGSEALAENILGSDDEYFNISSTDKISISSDRTGNIFEKINNSYGSKSYGSNTMFDFHSDNDFVGGSVHEGNVNSDFSLMLEHSYNGGKVLSLVRECGVGDDLVLNGNFDSDLNGWSVGASNFAWDVSQSAKTDRANSVQILTQTLTCPMDSLMISCEVKTATGSPFALCTMIMLSNGVAVETKTKAIKLGLMFPNKFMIVYRGNKLVDTIKIAIAYGGVGSLIADFYVDKVRMYRNRRGCPELVGRVIQDYFNDKNTITKKLKIDGIKRYNISDFLRFNGDKYYLKKLSYNLSDNETEIEAINYPY